MSALKTRLVQALPPAYASLLPWVFWTLVCGTACLVALIYTRGWALGEQTIAVTSLYTLGAALAFWPSLYCARLFAPKAGRLRFFWLIVFLAGGTIFFTSVLFALQFRLYFSQWHGPAFSKLWIWQQFFTAGSAVYTYFVLGLRFYFPIGIIGLAITSWWLNRQPD
ncbi:hypothetical protein WNY59_04245 [Ahrensia kielensis]|uniref:Uncharacterized protein n=1 Tax=Ahrensia kielensis TaxID=76980 RepID=A0ABU9T516_9HYPH